ncbi:MAG TPA: hypothetical protein VEJ38_02545 [Candidatus Acidoferrales bacterium]|nr:hypothetical protein [Candidatus Acidoferrales bacterium]
MRKRLIESVLGCTFLAAMAASASATTLLHMPVAKMTEIAKVILRARCDGNSTSWDAGEIWTFATFDAQEIWKGSLPERFNVRLLGGRLGNITSSVSGVPRFSPGEDVVLFLEPTPRGDFSIIAWEEGTFRVRRDPRSAEPLVTQDTAAFGTFDPPTRQFRTEGIVRMPLSAFRARVVQLVGSGAGGER